MLPRDTITHQMNARHLITKNESEPDEGDDQNKDDEQPDPRDLMQR